MTIDRAFVRIEEGPVHYRLKKAEMNAVALPLYMVHAGPVSSASLAPLMKTLSGKRSVLAPDTLGFGDSAPPQPDAPDLEYYADSVIRILDALEIDKVDYFGSHTGANIGVEIAISHPDRVRRLILDGIAVFDKQFRKELLENYAPERTPDEYGSQFQWAWQFIRDQSLFFPYYKRDAEHRLDNGVMPPEMLHDFTLDVLKALRTYHLGYRAVFRHDITARLPLVEQPVLLIEHETHPMTEFANDAVGRLKNANKYTVKNATPPAKQAKSIEEFLDRDAP